MPQTDSVGQQPDEMHFSTFEKNVVERGVPTHGSSTPVPTELRTSGSNSELIYTVQPREGPWKAPATLQQKLKESGPTSLLGQTKFKCCGKADGRMSGPRLLFIVATSSLLTLILLLWLPVRPVRRESTPLSSLRTPDWEQDFTSSNSSPSTFPVLKVYRDGFTAVREQFLILDFALSSDTANIEKLVDIANILRNLETAYQQVLERDADYGSGVGYRWHDGAYALHNLVREDIRQQEHSSIFDRLWNPALSSQARHDIRAQTVLGFSEAFCHFQTKVNDDGEALDSALNKARDKHLEMKAALSDFRKSLIHQEHETQLSRQGFGNGGKERQWLDTLRTERARIEEAMIWNCGQGNALLKNMEFLGDMRRRREGVGEAIRDRLEERAREKGLSNDELEIFMKELEAESKRIWSR